MSEQRLKGNVVLVTGASRGGGKGIALVLGEQGATYDRAIISILHWSRNSTPTD